MVAKDDQEKPAVVPNLILETREDVKRFIEALNVRKVKGTMKEQMNDARSHIDIANAAELLKSERCILEWK
jgi:hypothetical protein